MTALHTNVMKMEAGYLSDLSLSSIRPLRYVNQYQTLKEQVENYVGDAAIDGINYHDIALTFGQVHRQDAYMYGDK